MFQQNSLEIEIDMQSSAFIREFIKKKSMFNCLWHNWTYFPIKYSLGIYQDTHNKIPSFMKLYKWKLFKNLPGMLNFVLSFLIFLHIQWIWRFINEGLAKKKTFTGQWSNWDSPANKSLFHTKSKNVVMHEICQATWFFNSSRGMKKNL